MARRTATTQRRLHEVTQRGLCQLVFMLLGLLPVLLATGWSIAQFVPSYQSWRARTYSAWLSQKLGVEVQIVAVEWLAPQRTTLHGIKLVHPESHVVLGRMRSVEVLNSGSMWIVRLDAPELDGRHLPATWQLVHDWFVCRPQAFAPNIQLASEGLVIRNLADSHTTVDEQWLQQLSVGIYPQVDETRLIAKFRGSTSQANGNLSSGNQPNGESAPPATLMISRRHRESQQSTQLLFKTEETRLPCALIAPVFPELRFLGSRAVLAGTFSLLQRNAAWRLEIQNAWLAKIDCGQLPIGGETAVTGEGALWCDQATITQRGLQSFEGAAYVDHGRMDRRILAAAEQNLGLHLVRDVQSANVSTIMFEHLRCRFRILPQVLQWVGFADQEAPSIKPLAPGTLMTDAAGAIAVRAQTDGIPLQNLVLLLNQVPLVASASTFPSLMNGDSDSGRLTLHQAALRWLPLH